MSDIEENEDVSNSDSSEDDLELYLNEARKKNENYLGKKMI